MNNSAFILGLEDRLIDSVFETTSNLFQRAGHNLGNLAFHHAIKKHLPGITRQVNWDASPGEIENAGLIGIIPSANQIGEHSDYQSLGEKFEKLKIPLVSIGLGAQSGFNKRIPEVPEGTIRWVKSISDRSINNTPNIAVRGEFSLQVLEHYGLSNNAIVLGCPTLFINPNPELGRIIDEKPKKIERIAVTSGHPEWEALASIEASLANAVKATNGIYVGQSPLEMVSVTRGEGKSLKPDVIEKYRDYICPEMDISEFLKWCRQHGKCYFDISTWMEDYRRFDLVIGTRIHGVMLGLQAGIPSICIAHDSRTVELCETMQVPHLYAKNHWQGITRKEIERKVNEFDADAFDKNRVTLAKKYIKFLANNNLTPAHWLKDFESQHQENETNKT